MENLLCIPTLFLIFLRAAKNAYSLENRPFIEISGKSHSRGHCQITAAVFSGVISLAEAAGRQKGGLLPSAIISFADF